MIEPIVRTIEVPCDQKKAFRVFVNDMPTWWPLHKRSMSLKFSGKPPKELRVAAKLGGQIVEIGQDGAEHLYGTITAYAPHESVRMDFHMGMPPDKASVVEVKFVVLGPQRTRVELTQSNWEAFGDMAEMLRGGYDSGWVIILDEAYRAACGR